MERSKRSFATLGGAKMERHFVCGDCGAKFDYPITRFDNGLKVCPACLSFVTDDAWGLFLQKLKWFKKARLRSDNWEKLSNCVFPVDTKLIFEDE